MLLNNLKFLSGTTIGVWASGFKIDKYATVISVFYKICDACFFLEEKNDSNRRSR